MAVSGNHEVEKDDQGRSYQAYSTRYVYPYKESGSRSQQEYSFDAAGARRALGCITTVFRVLGSCAGLQAGRARSRSTPFNAGVRRRALGTAWLVGFQGLHRTLSYAKTLGTCASPLLWAARHMSAAPLS